LTSFCQQHAVFIDTCGFNDESSITAKMIDFAYRSAVGFICLTNFQQGISDGVCLTIFVVPHSCSARRCSKRSVRLQEHKRDRSCLNRKIKCLPNRFLLSLHTMISSTPRIKQSKSKGLLMN